MKIFHAFFLNAKEKNSSPQYIPSNGQIQNTVQDLILKLEYSKSTTEQNYCNTGNIDCFFSFFLILIYLTFLNDLWGLESCLSYPFKNNHSRLEWFKSLS